MRLLTRTGESGRTRVGYVRKGAQITVTDEQAKLLKSEGGWSDDGAAPKRRRLTEVPTRTAAREPARATSDAEPKTGASEDESDAQGGAQDADVTADADTERDADADSKSGKGARGKGKQ